MTGDPITVGVVTPHAAAGPEVELPAITAGRVATLLFRTGPPPGASPRPSRTGPPGHAQLRASTEPAAIDRAALTFMGKSLAAVVHASTTSGYVIGHREEAVLVERLSQRLGVPAVASCSAVVAALRTHRIERVHVVHPPWFADELDDLGDAYFRSQGFDPAVTKAVGLPGDPARMESRHVVDWIEHHLEDRAEAVFLAGNGFRAAGAVEELELRTGRLVVEANQALLWQVLTAVGATWDVTGYGRLFQANTSPR